MAKRGALWVMTALAVAALCLGAPLAAQGPQRVGLVLVFDAQRVETRCVSFSEVQITGTEVLERSGLEVVLNRTVGLGAGGTGVTEEARVARRTGVAEEARVAAGAVCVAAGMVAFPSPAAVHDSAARAAATPATPPPATMTS